MKTGYEAIEAKERDVFVTLNKYADPIDGAEENISIDRAREISAEDPALIWSPSSAAAFLGRKGGKAKSAAKAKAAAANGAKGGRPRAPRSKVTLWENPENGSLSVFETDCHDTSLGTFEVVAEIEYGETSTGERGIFVGGNLMYPERQGRGFVLVAGIAPDDRLAQIRLRRIKAE